MAELRRWTATASLTRPAVLLAILILAAVLRWWGWDYGLPHPMARPDEEITLEAAYQMFASGNPDPVSLPYPSFIVYLDVAALSLLLQGGGVPGPLRSASRHALRHGRTTPTFSLPSGTHCESRLWRRNGSARLSACNHDLPDSKHRMAGCSPPGHELTSCHLLAVCDRGRGHYVSRDGGGTLCRPSGFVVENVVLCRRGHVRRPCCIE